MIYTPEPGEVVQTSVHKHWLLLAFPLVLFGVVLIAPFTVIPAYFGNSFAALVPLSDTLLVMLGIMWVMMIWCMITQVWTDHHLDMWLITNQRIIDVEQDGFFSRRVSTFRLDRIQDVTIDISGFWNTMFNFGDIIVDTAGGQTGRFTMHNIFEPKVVKDIISKQLDQTLTNMHRP